MSFDPSPYTPDEIWSAFHEDTTFSKHLLTIYALAVGLDARVIADLGIGSTTRALRAAARRTGGVVHSCDVDAGRYAGLARRQHEDWKLHLGSSDTFIAGLPVPVDFAVHDAAHDYFQVKLDLELLIPRMRRFSLICVHDTQQPDLAPDMLAAIRDATHGVAISATHLPYNAGLTILRIENGPHPERPVEGLTAREKKETRALAAPLAFATDSALERADTSWARWVRWRLRKLVKGF